MLLHGNVGDLLFDGELGFAPLETVLEHHWLRGELFRGRSARALITCSVARGLELGPGSREALEGDALPADLERHREENARLAPPARLLADLAFLEGLRRRDASPALGVLFTHAGMAFPAEGGLATAPLVDRILGWARQQAGDQLTVLAEEDADALAPQLRRRSSGVLTVELHWREQASERVRFAAAALAACGRGAVPRPHSRLAVRDTDRATELPFGAGDLDRLVDATAGLNHAGVEACFLRFRQRGDAEPEAALRTLHGVRADLLRTDSQGLIELEDLDEAHLDPIAGQAAEVLDKLLWVAEAMALPESDPRRALLPMGVLLAGVPGTGKSLLARHLAARCHRQGGIHFLRLGDFRDMWVGSTERNFARVLRLLRSFGKAIVFLDEIDQSEGGSRSGQRHETSRRVFGKLLQLMASPEHRGRTLWVAATNRPDDLDPAMLRPGRFDAVVSIGVPGPEDCRAILAKHLERSPMDAHLGPKDLEELGRQMAERCLVGSEIQFLVTEASRRALERGDRELRVQDLARVVRTYVAAHKDTPDYRRMAQQCAAFGRFRDEE